MRGNLQRAHCRPGYIECDPSDIYPYCFPVHKMCDGILDCGGGQDELGCIRSVEYTSETTARDANDDDSTKTIVTRRDAALFSATVYSKLTKLDKRVYLEVERLINHVLYEGQTGLLSNQSTIQTRCTCLNH